MASKCGLKLNKNKSMIMIYNSDQAEKPADVEGIKTVSKIKYLGFEVTDKRNCLTEHKNNNFNKAKKMTNILHSVVARTYMRVKIGKTYWKGLAMPIFLYGAEVIDYNQSDLKQLQTIDNKAYTIIIQARSYTAVEGLRGDIGASCSISRDMKTKILFVKHLLDDGNELAKSIFEIEYQEQKSAWSRLVANYLQELYIQVSNISQMTSALTKTIKEWDTERWLKGMKNKETLRVYGKFKNKIEEETCFTNNQESKLLFRARTDIMELNWRKRGEQNSKLCPYCDQEETLKHFLLESDAYNEIRAQHLFLARPYKEDPDELIADFLLLSQSKIEADIYERKNTLQEMWKKRQLMNTTSNNL